VVPNTAAGNVLVSHWEKSVKRRTLGRTGLVVSPIALGGAPFGNVNKTNNWDPYSEDGRQIAHSTINHALDRGINLLDTSAGYGDNHSETLYGEVLKTRRKDCVLANKARFYLDKQGVIDSVHASLKRLQTDYIDVLQIHGHMFSQVDYDHVVSDGGPLDALCELREQGKIGHIGITGEEPWTLIPFLAHKEIDVYQIHYSIIFQGAGRHFLIEAEKQNVGVLTMRTMTGGIFQIQTAHFAPEWQAAHDIADVNIKFVLSDSRVHSGIVGMRWRDEVDRNIATVSGWEPPVDVATLPRWTFEVYKAQDV
jgi:aryl-alcohol dehydrogenase-like predicted oxidoreductase